MIKLALPTGDLRTPVGGLLSSSGLKIEGYSDGSRQYRLVVPGAEDVRVRVFRERDIPVQLALGSYDIGITSLVWVEEMQVRFPQQPIAPLADLGLGASPVWAASSEAAGDSLAGLARLPVVRLASDYPNIADAFARAARLRRYRVQAVWGAAEAYPPEDADVAVVALNEAGLRAHGLRPLWRVLDSSAWVIANVRSLAEKDLSPVLGRVLGAGDASPNGHLSLPAPIPVLSPSPDKRERAPGPGGPIRLALPDGHQQGHVVEALAAAGLAFEGYDEGQAVRRPKSPIDGLAVKVIRPHDMPQLVALGEFDLAITGRDCLSEHLYAFPASPVEEVVDLQRAQYNLSAVVSEDLPADDIEGALAHWRREGKRALTVAAEFPATADHYARMRHFWRYQVIPIAGASEGFVPEDAEMLIEGTETGRTLAANRLKIIDHIYRSTTCVIARRDSPTDGRRGAVYSELLAALRRSSAD